MKVKSASEVAQSCPTLSDPMDCSPPGSSIHGIFQARVLEWVAVSFSGLLHLVLPYRSVASDPKYYTLPHQCHSMIFGKGNGTPLQCFCQENPMDGRAWWATVHGVTKSWTRLSNFTFTFHFHALEKEMATHSSVLAWRIPGTGEPGGLPSMGSLRVGHD